MTSRGIAECGTTAICSLHIMRFNLAMDHAESGMSFRQTASAIQHAKERTKTAKLAGITDLMVSQYVCVQVGSTLQQIVDCLDDESVWAMSLAGDGSMHRGQSFSDLRVRICFRGRLLNCTWSRFSCSITTWPAISLTC
jgi:predicted transcriptional regulator